MQCRGAMGGCFWSFLSTLLRAWAFLTVSGALIVLSYLASYRDSLSLGSHPAITWGGDSLEVETGGGAAVGGRLVIRSLVEVEDPVRPVLGAPGIAEVAARDVRVDAQRYPILRYRLSGLAPETDLWLVWGTQGGAARGHKVRLPWNGHAGTAYLGRNPGWEGTVVELGLLIRGVLAGPAEVQNLTLESATPAALLSAVWTEWTGFEGWSSRSINRIVGGPEGPLVPPTLAVGAWVILALLLHGLEVLVRKGVWSWRIAGIVVLTGWLALDARWQVDLSRQVEATERRYGELAREDKPLAAHDGTVYQFVRDIEQLLPPTPQRIFVVVEAPEQGRDRYLRLRVRYHLYPHNVYANDPSPPTAGQARRGDYVLTLGDVPRLHYDAERRILSWEHGQLAAELMLRAPMGRLYRLL